MNISYFVKKSPLKVHCEDAYFINRPLGLFGVMDGVTPIDKYANEEGHNGAYVAANLFKQYFEQTDGQLELRDAVADANHQLKMEMLRNNVDISIVYELWSTCAAIVRIQGEVLNYAQIGDSMIVASYRDGRVEPLVVNTVQGINQRARAKREAERSKGISLPDESYYDEFLPSARFNRSMANTRDGYGVANGMDEVKDYIQTGSIPLASLQHVLLITDGFFYPGRTLEYTIRHIIDHGFEHYIEEVERVEVERGDLPDDRTAIWIKF